MLESECCFPPRFVVTYQRTIVNTPLSSEIIIVTTGKTLTMHIKVADDSFKVADDSFKVADDSFKVDDDSELIQGNQFVSNDDLFSNTSNRSVEYSLVTN